LDSGQGYGFENGSEDGKKKRLRGRRKIPKMVIEI